MDTKTEPRSDFYIYALCRHDGRVFYIGKGQRNRWLCHEGYARKGARGRRYAIIRDMQARGVEVIKVKLHVGLTEAVAHTYEVALIAAIGRGRLGPLVNLTDGGEGVTGMKHSTQHREKLSVEGRGRVFSAETRAKIGSARRGKTMSAESKAKIAAAKCGKRLSPEHCAKMSAALRGRVPSPEAIAKTAAANRGRKMSPETRTKLLAANLGRKLSPEEISKRSATVRANNARRRAEPLNYTSIVGSNAPTGLT
jgi:hypothetical protein